MIRPLPRAVSRAASRVVWCVVVAVGALILTAPAVGADGVRPGNFESVIDAVEPRTSGLAVEIIGGDSFIQITAAPGTEVTIPGYDGEPYLRITSDGTVEQNRRSPATYLNASRYGGVERFPSEVSSTAAPDWERIGSGGEVAWHDHRIHWMLDDAPAVSDEGVVQEWNLALQVDGSEVVVSGRLLHRGDVFPWAAILAAVVALGAALLARRDAWRAPLLLGAATGALALSLGTHALNPPGADPTLLPLVLPVVGVLACVAALGLRRLPPTVHALALPLAAIAAILGWAVPQLGVLWMPTVPSMVVSWVARAGTGAVIGVAVGVAVAILLRPLPAADGSATPVGSAHGA